MKLPKNNITQEENSKEYRYITGLSMKRIWLKVNPTPKIIECLKKVCPECESTNLEWNKEEIKKANGFSEYVEKFRCLNKKCSEFNKFRDKTDIKYTWVDSLSSGVGVSLWAQSDTGAIISTGTFLGEKKLSSEKLGFTVAQEMIDYIQNEIPVDKYLSDQLVPLMGYVRKSSSIKVSEITSHTRTNLELIKLFTNREYKILKHDNNHIITFQ